MIGFDFFGVEAINYGRGRINRMYQTFTGSPQTILRRSGQTVLDAMREAVPVAQEDENWQSKNREHARDRLEFHIRNGDEGTFEGPQYLQYVIEGTGEYELFPVNGQALSFFIGGEQLAFAHVTIPGRDPNDFRKTAWDSSKSDVKDIVREVGMKVIRGET